MEPKLVRIAPFTVRGLRIRTKNGDEMKPETAKIPGLWGRFSSEKIAERVPARIANSPIYGVYSSYESDATGLYDLTAGVSVTALPAAAGFESVEIRAGDYLVFEGQGPMPRVVIETWSAVWKHFAGASQHRRAFTTDFEVYRGPDGVAIHVAIAR